MGSAIYWGTASGNYTNRVDAGTNATVTIFGLQEGTTYYFAAVAYDVQGEESVFSNEVSYKIPASIGGSVAYSPASYPASGLSGKRLENVSIRLTGDLNLDTLTGGDGSYTLDGLTAGGTYAVTPGKTGDTPVANGVTSFDLALIHGHILGLTTLGSPYQLLAADVDGSGTVTSFDLALVHGLVLGFNTNLAGRLWRFVPADYVFPDPSRPWNAPGARWYTNLMASLSAEDFVAIKLGDLNNSWVPPGGAQVLKAKPAPAEDAGPEVAFHLSRQRAVLGQRVSVPLMASGFAGITSVQFTLSWDPAVLRYLGTGDYRLRGISQQSFGEQFAAAGQLPFAWYDPEATGVTAANETSIFSVDFEVVGLPGSRSALRLTDSPVAREVAVNGEVAPMFAEDGDLTVVPPNATQLSVVERSEGAFALSFPTEADRKYVLEFTEALLSPIWKPLSTIQGDGTRVVITDPRATNHQRFYRVRIE